MKTDLVQEKTEQREKDFKIKPTKFIDLVARYIGARLLIAVIILFSLGILLVYLSFGKSETSTFYYILLEIAKALFITAVISGGVKWYMTRQYIKVEEVKEDVLRLNYLIH